MRKGIWVVPVVATMAVAVAAGPASAASQTINEPVTPFDSDTVASAEPTNTVNG